MKKIYVFFCLFSFSLAHNTLLTETPTLPQRAKSAETKSEPQSEQKNPQKNESDTALEDFLDPRQTHRLKDPKVQAPQGRISKMLRYIVQRVGISVLSCILSIKEFFVK